MPEDWVHAELYAYFKRQSGKNNLQVFPTEVPFITFYPVQFPKEDYMNWKMQGAVKWVDLCLKSKNNEEWLWVELKVRNAIYTNNYIKMNKEARNAFRKDIIALIGFDTKLTSVLWKAPDSYVKDHWHDKILKPNYKNLLEAKHHFISIYLQLEKEPEPDIWDKSVLVEQVHKWLQHRKKASANKKDLPDLTIEYFYSFYKNRYSLITSSW